MARMVCDTGLQEARLHRRAKLVHENVGYVGQRRLELWRSDGKGRMGMMTLYSEMDLLEP